MASKNQIKPSGSTNVKILGAKGADSVELSTANPLPISFGGASLTTLQGLNYIPFFAPEDNLFRSLLELRLLSPTQDSCIKDKTFYSVGSGLQIKDKEFPKEFDRKINSDRETIDDILEGIFNGYFQDGNAFLEIAKTTIGGKKFVQVYLHNNMDCRFEENKDGSNPTHVLRSKQFRRDSYFVWKKEDEPIRIPLWNDDPAMKEKVWVKKGDVERTMIHLKNKVAGIDAYGLPSNFSGFMNAVLEYRSARFNGDNFENNMFAAGILMIQGNLSTEEEKALLKKIRRENTGEGKNMRVITMASEGGITDSKFIPFTQSNDGHFLDADKHWENKIIGANNWSRSLLDMNETGSLGKGGEYLKVLFKMKFQTVIMPAQQKVLNNFIFPLMKIIDEFKGTKLYTEKWTINPVIPVGLEGMLDINSLLTVDEGRKEINRDELGGEKGAMLISEVKAKPAAEEKTEKPLKEENK